MNETSKPNNHVESIVLCTVSLIGCLFLCMSVSPRTRALCLDIYIGIHHGGGDTSAQCVLSHNAQIEEFAVYGYFD